MDRVAPAAQLVAALRAALPDAHALPIHTSAAVGGARNSSSQAPLVEAMEGFGVLRAAALAGVPAVEVRAISNEIGEDDRARWDIDAGLAALDARAADDDGRRSGGARRAGYAVAGPGRVAPAPRRSAQAAAAMSISVLGPPILPREVVAPVARSTW